MISYCVACMQPFQRRNPQHRYCSKECQVAYRRTSSGNYPPPEYVGDYDLLPEHIRRNFTPGDPKECWPYARRSPNGYAHNTSVRMHKTQAYRLIYMMMVGPIPEGLDIAHICHNGKGGCVNWHHLKPMTHKENMAMADTVTSWNRQRSTCRRGHAFTPENTYIIPATGSRMCIACRDIRLKARASRIINPCTRCGNAQTLYDLVAEGQEDELHFCSKECIALWATDSFDTLRQGGVGS